MTKKIAFTASELNEATGQGQEFLIDKQGNVLAMFNDGNMVDSLPRGNTEVTKTAA